MGIDTLRAISKLIEDITNIADYQHNPQYAHMHNLKGKLLHLKAKKVRALLIRSIPLLKKEYIESVGAKIMGIQFDWLPRSTGRPIRGNEDTPVPPNYYEAYNPALDLALDKMIMELCFSLQQSGKYFMHEKMDSGL